MKLIKHNYTHPFTKGLYPEMFVEERIGQLDRHSNYLKVDFIMYWLDNGEKQIIAEAFMPFKGVDFTNESTNQTMMCLLEGETEPVPMLPILMANAGVLPDGAVITEIGYPNFTDVQQYFDGGSIQSPEIIVTNPLARMFILKKCIINGDTLENQGFEFVE